MLKYVVAALAAVCLALGLYIRYQAGTIATQQITISQQSAALKAAKAKIKRDARTAVVRAAKAKATAIKDKEATSAKDKALAADPDWGAQPLPAAVGDWLRDQSTGVHP